MKQLLTYVSLCLIAVMMVAAIGKDQAKETRVSYGPSPELVQEQPQAGAEIATPIVEGTEAQNAENINIQEKALEMLNLTSAEHLSLKEKLALKIVRGKLKKDVRRIKKGKKTTAGDNQLVALLLCFFVGYLGIHRFYLGYIGLGVLELLTGGLCGILTLIDFIRIILGTLKPKGGEYSKTL